MSVIAGVHDDHGATFRTVDGRRVVAHYGRPERTHRAVRNAAGVFEPGYDVRVVTGADRVAAVERAITGDVPTEDGEGCYGFVREEGVIATDVAVYNAAANDRLLCFCAPGRGDVLDAVLAAADQDTAVEDATDDLAVFGVHGGEATEKIASVLSTGGGAPEPPYSFMRGTMGEEGVTVVASDGPTGEEGYEVVAAAGDAERVFDTLVNRGLNATPFGYRTWESLTLEAGTPLYHTELRDRDPSILDASGGQRLVGLTCEAVPDPGAAVLGDAGQVGTVTRAIQSPSLGEPIALAVVDGAVDAVETTDGRATAALATLPFLEGSQRSGRLPDV